MDSKEQFKKRYAQLNSAQKQAVDTVEGPVLVVAGPGTGKTELLSMRVANILLQTDASPSNILCLTFTESATAAMRERLARLIGPEAYKVSIHTFHEFGNEIIGRHPEYFYDGAQFSPIDDVLKIELLEGVFRGLPYGNPLRTIGPDGSFVYIKSCISTIKDLKKGGLTPEGFRAVLEQNSQYLQSIELKIDEVLSNRISIRDLPRYRSLIKDLRNESSQNSPIPLIEVYVDALANMIESKVESCEESGKTQVLSEWKKKRISKTVDGRYILQDQKYLLKMEALADIYGAYQKSLHTHMKYDFEDMLLNALGVVETHLDLQYELQEQYQYVLVDEFQDTNEAQMRLLYALTNAEVNEGRPNLLVVGDDDQSIFKFQGAEIANILQFQKQMQSPAIIVLTENYRSTQHILDLSRQVIVQAEERLENSLEEVQKTLRAANESISGGGIHTFSYVSQEHEFYALASTIKELITNGTDPNSIAVISRKHSILEDLVPYLHQAHIPISYERQRNVLLEPHIHQLIQVATFIDSLMSSESTMADHLLPEILSYPFWEVSRTSVWELALEVQKSRKLWMECMLESTDQKIQDIAHFFRDLAIRATHEPLEYILDSIIGDLSEDAKEGFSSPFRSYYFNPILFTYNSQKYVSFLSSLKVFFEALREYGTDHVAQLDDLVRFVQVRAKNNLSLTDISPFINGAQAVSLMSAHKSKGLEFDTVFVVSCQERVWAKSGGTNFLPLPVNLPFEANSENTDDFLRLFYVALTRAKRNLYISSYRFEANGKASPILQFISNLEQHEFEGSELESLAVLTASWEGLHFEPITSSDRSLLASSVESYQLSVTHLRNFLDVTRGGPQYFLQQNLLQFPQKKELSGSFGSVVHANMEFIYAKLKIDSELPNIEKTQRYFNERLLKERLLKADFEYLLGRGNQLIKNVYDQKLSEFEASHLIEVNFKHEGVVINEAHITGKIDKIIKLSDSNYSVHDFKTGKPQEDWEPKNAHERIKLWGYHQQLVFYKLLIEHSGRFGKSGIVKEGALEFLEANDEGRLTCLSLDLGAESTDRLTNLIQIVFKKIKNLDFPDTSHYDQKTIEGIVQFEDDLLGGRI